MEFHHYCIYELNFVTLYVFFFGFRWYWKNTQSQLYFTSGEQLVIPFLLYIKMWVQFTVYLFEIDKRSQFTKKKRSFERSLYMPIIWYRNNRYIIITQYHIIYQLYIILCIPGKPCVQIIVVTFYVVHNDRVLCLLYIIIIFLCDSGLRVL